MPKLKFFITDVFAEKKYAGNPLATFLNAGDLSAEEMQQIAREVNFSETTFILSNDEREGGYDVRIFAPGQELEFAGHPSLGTAYILQKHVLTQPEEKVVLNLKVGQIPISFPNGADATLWMEQMEPTFGEVFEPESIAAVLSLPVDAIDTRFPIQEVSTGFPHFIVPLKSLDSLRAAIVDKQRYFSLVASTGVNNILVFSPEAYSHEQTLSVRMFADAIGIPEDPATGSGNGCLAGYLVKHRSLQSESIDIKVGQGYEIGRPSVLSLRAGDETGKIRVAVGGKIVPVAEGVWGG